MSKALHFHRTKTVVSAVTLWQEGVRSWYSIGRRRVVLQVLALNWEGLSSISLKVCQISSERQLRAAWHLHWQWHHCPSCASKGSVCDSSQMLLKSDG